MAAHEVPPSAGEHGHEWAVSGRTRRSLTIAVLACLAVTVVGLVALWPRGSADVTSAAATAFSRQVNGTVTTTSFALCSFSTTEQGFQCESAVVHLTSGPTAGSFVTLELPLNSGIVELHEGDKVVLGYEPDAPEPARYQFVDFQRGSPLLVLTLIFVVAVIALGRLRGLLALAGLGVSVATLLVFLLPSLLRGNAPLAVALVGASVIAFAALYMAHGVNIHTTVALLGTLASLALVGVLAVVFVGASKITGLADESSGFLQLTAGSIDLRGLVLAGIVIGSLGVLDDVTVTQVSAVGELHNADPTLGRLALYAAGIRIGRDHIASTVNTLVLAYAGASLPLLLLFVEASRRLGTVVTSEVVAVEVVRTLVGSIGLVASVPLTTALAAAVVARDEGRVAEAMPVRTPRRKWPSRRVRDAARAPARWDDFSPEA